MNIRCFSDFQVRFINISFLLIFSWLSTFPLVLKIVTKLRVIDQTSGMVRMSSLGKSHENRDLYVLRVLLS